MTTAASSSLRQSRTIVEAARRGASIERAAFDAADGEARDRVFISLRGVGVWTSAETRIRAFGIRMP